MGGTAWGYGTHYRVQGNSFVGFHKICYGRFMWRTKDSEREGSRQFGEEEMGKIESGLVVSKQAEGLICPCPAPDRHGLSYLLINSISNYFRGWGDCILCACVWRAMCQQLESGHGQGDHKTVTPATTVTESTYASVWQLANIELDQPSSRVTVLGPIFQSSNKLCVSLCVRPPEQLATMGTRRSRATARETVVSGVDWEMCADLCKMALHWGCSPGACMTWCQQLGRLGSMNSYCADQVSGLDSAVAVFTCSYIFPLMDLHPGLPERWTGWGCCLHLCACWVYMSALICVACYVHWCRCGVCVHACWPHWTWGCARGSLAFLWLLGWTASCFSTF